MTQLYRKYMRLLDKWPLDKTKVEGENSKLQNQELCEQNYQSLDKIASNYYAKKYPHNFKKTSTGLSQELCSLAMNHEVQKALQLELENSGFFSKVKNSVKHIVNKYRDQ
ncbi:ubiquinol-cytochrome-c reductase complex assembly factor 2 [Phymastichus coffea]|uniref:ubiquinol-cytochrome-c reductase complex assembly factor 2 n=1 Tax=Phymastichus coffea TaxID=108790 RepID=UPI00273C10C0|nr:ubiquinol-cytochrome-c reductase complex assembly factor 2 [Phymastichus coffea]